MTLLQELEALQPKALNGEICPDQFAEDCLSKVRTFADKLEGEDIVEKAAIAIAQGLAKKAPPQWMMAQAKKDAKAALAVVRGMIG